MRTFLVPVVVCLAVFQPLARATTVDVSAAGNVLAGTSISNIGTSSPGQFFAGEADTAFDNLVGTSDQDNGQVFDAFDAHQVLTVTGFDSAISELRFFSVPSDGIRVPGSLTIYYSTLSTTSIDSGDGSFSGANGGVLVSIPAFDAGLLDQVVSDVASYMVLQVNAPAGTRSLLFDLGVSDSDGVPYGDRISEVQAFATAAPTPGVAMGFVPAVVLLIASRRCRK